MVCIIEGANKELKEKDVLKYDTMVMLTLSELRKKGFYPIKIEALEDCTKITIEHFNKEHIDLYENVIKEESPLFFSIQNDLEKKLKDEMLDPQTITNDELHKLLLDNYELQKALQEREENNKN